MPKIDHAREIAHKTILSESPEIPNFNVPESATKATTAATCAYGPCGAELQPPLLRCSRCKQDAYCSKACQVQLVLLLCLGFTLTSDRAIYATLRHQTAAWKTGHDKECGTTVARVTAAMLASAAPTKTERQLLARLCKLEKTRKRDSLGVLHLEPEGLARFWTLECSLSSRSR